MTPKQEQAWAHDLLRNKQSIGPAGCISLLLSASLSDSERRFLDMPESKSPEVESWRRIPHCRYHR